MGNVPRSIRGNQPGEFLLWDDCREATREIHGRTVGYRTRLAERPIAQRHRLGSSEHYRPPGDEAPSHPDLARRCPGMIGHLGSSDRTSVDRATMVQRAAGTDSARGGRSRTPHPLRRARRSSTARLALVWISVHRAGRVCEARLSRRIICRSRSPIRGLHDNDSQTLTLRSQFDCPPVYRMGE